MIINIFLEVKINRTVKSMKVLLERDIGGLASIVMYFTVKTLDKFEMYSLLFILSFKRARRFADVT